MYPTMHSKKARLLPFCLGLLAMLLLTRPAFAEIEITYDWGSPVPEAEAFQTKPLSGSAKNVTARYHAQNTPSRSAGKAFSRAMADTSLRLLQAVSAKEASGTNILISPDSILTAVSILENGASGDTLREIRAALGGIPVKKYNQYLKTLHTRIASPGLMTYQIANSVWYRKNSIKLKRAYLQDMVSYYQAEVYEAPFDSRTVGDINNWVFNHTKGRIPSILSRLPSEARTAIINAVYFKGEWQKPYTTVRKRTFTKENGAKKKVRMMEGTETIYVTLNGAKGFVKPYRGGEAAFMALLPPKGKSVSSFVRDLTGEDWINAYQNRITSHIQVLTRMPRFKYEYSVSLPEPLRALGIRKAFSNGAEFGRMSKSEIRIDQVLHKTFIAVDENGTEAAAATAITMNATSVYEPPESITIKKVYLNRPFVYAIIDTKTGIPLFLGIVRR